MENLKQIQIIEHEGIRTLTSDQIADLYGVTSKKISNNFNNNKGKYLIGKHYVTLTGKKLQEFLQSYKIGQQNASKIRVLYLWTEKGALLHAKSLNTDKAWEVYDYLVDFYFRAKDSARQQPQESGRQQPVQANLRPIPVIQQTSTIQVVNAPDNEKIQNLMQKVFDDLTCMKVLVEASNKYLNMEEYTSRIRAACEVIPLLYADMGLLAAEPPKMVNKII